MTKWAVVRQVSLVAILGGAVLAATMASSRRSGDQTFFDPIIDVRKLIEERYVDAVDEKKLQDGAIAGMVEALNDPYTVYVPAEHTKRFEKDLTGEYSGIGAQVNINQGWLTIVTPLEDSPAFKMGIMPDDRVVEIEGKSTFGLDVDECVDILTGKEGTPVNLVIERAGQKIPFTITRQKIKTRSVKGFHRDQADTTTWQYLVDEPRGIAYLRLTQFTPGCAREIAEALLKAGAAEGRVKGLVLDLRYNPGGLLEEAINIADFFLTKGTIVSTRGRAFKPEVAEARERGTFPNFPIAILLNEQSASASEVLAGALSENDRAIVVGTRSFGKGSVQSVQRLDTGGGAELKITEQGYFLPSGRSIHRKEDSATWGVDPTPGFYVPLSDAEELDLLKARRDQELLRVEGKAKEDEKWSDPAWVMEKLKDKQLAAALEAVQIRVDSGAWKATGQQGIDTSKIAVDELKKLVRARDLLTKDLIRMQKRIVAVETAVPDAEKKTPIVSDLWADNPDVKGGKVEVYDKNGKLVATLDVTGNDLERWLAEADVTSQNPPPPPSDKAPAEKPAEKAPDEAPKK